MNGTTAQRLAHRRRLLVGRAHAQRQQLTQDLLQLGERLRPTALVAQAWDAVRRQPGLAVALVAGLWVLRRGAKGRARGGWLGRGLLAWRLWQSLRRRQGRGGAQAEGPPPSAGPPGHPAAPP